MLKRKREEAHSGRDEGEDRALRIRKNRLVAQLGQCNKLLHRALKVARGFERRKLGRRQKNAKGNPQDLLRLKEEVIVLKDLDLAKTAENYLFKQLARTKRTREAPAFVSLYGKDAESKVKGAKAGAEANVVGRLMSSNPVKEAMPRIMSTLYRCLGSEGLSSSTKPQQKIKKVLTTNHSKTKSVGSDVNGKMPDSDHEDLPHIRHDLQSDSFKDDHDDESMAELDRLIAATSGSEDFEDMAQHKHRLASSSHSNDGSNAEDDDNFESMLPHTGCRPRAENALSLSLSPSPSPTPSRSISPLPPRADHTPIHKPSAPKPQPEYTTFLPSLTLGGYFSGSESDSDVKTQHNRLSSRRAIGPGPALSQPHKNRRGQRARQQIAEKKYGSGAIHLQQQQQLQGRLVNENRDRDVGWDSRKGATDDGALNRRAKGKEKGKRGQRNTGRRSGEGRLGPTGGNSEAMAVANKSKGRNSEVHGKANVNDGPLHPSWEAAKKRKAQSQKVTGLFQGKKITF